MADLQIVCKLSLCKTGLGESEHACLAFVGLGKLGGICTLGKNGEKVGESVVARVEGCLRGIFLFTFRLRGKRGRYFGI